MNHDPLDEKFREFYHELRQRDERCAASFAQVYQAALTRGGTARARGRAVRWAIVTALVLGVPVGVYFGLGYFKPPLVRTSPLAAIPPQSQPRPVASLLPVDLAMWQWHSPTAVLLQPPDRWLAIRGSATQPGVDSHAVF